jgi:hypothetical protein
MGVVGEERNRLILLLAGIGRTLPEPPSVLVKGSSSSGKSTLVKDSVQLFPPDSVLERAGLSGKALAYGSDSLANKILMINEYRCGKDSQLLLRLLQSESRISHASTTIRGRQRGTRTVERIGMPVVLTTTTDDKVFTDDETRFLCRLGGRVAITNPGHLDSPSHQDGGQPRRLARVENCDAPTDLPKHRFPKSARLAALCCRTASSHQSPGQT